MLDREVNGARPLGGPKELTLSSVDSLPSSWVLVNLGDVVSLRRHTVAPATVPNLPYVGLEHIDTGQPVLKRWGSPEEVRSAKSRFFSRDVLYGKLRPYLDKAVLADRDGVCSTDVLVFVSSEAIVPEFLGYLVHTMAFVDHAIATTAGVNHPRTSWAALKDFRVRLPSLPEQRAIAHVLRTVQRARDAADVVIAATRELKKSLLCHLFAYGPVSVHQIGTTPLRETEVGPVPSHWRIITLGSCIEQAQYGLSVRGHADGAHPILRMNSLVEGKVVPRSLQYVDLDQRTLETFRLREGDVLFNRTNSHELVGKTGLFDLPGDFVFASYLVRLSVKRKTLDPRWLNYYLNMDSTQRRLKSLASRGVSQANISASKLKVAVIPLPPLGEQEAAVRSLAVVDAKLQRELSRRRALDALFNTLLHDLMTGKLRVREIEPIVADAVEVA